MLLLTLLPERVTYASCARLSCGIFSVCTSSGSIPFSSKWKTLKYILENKKQHRIQPEKTEIIVGFVFTTAIIIFLNGYLAHLNLLLQMWMAFLVSSGWKHKSSSSIPAELHSTLVTSSWLINLLIYNN
jgi:hypothetical protein